MSALKYKRASGWSLWLLKAIRMYAIVMPWGVCYTRWTLPLWPEKQRHEEKHWEQYQRHGRIKFIILYLIESIRKGYWDNKYEIEARDAEWKIP